MSWTTHNLIPSTVVGSQLNPTGTYIKTLEIHAVKASHCRGGCTGTAKHCVAALKGILWCPWWKGGRSFQGLRNDFNDGRSPSHMRRTYDERRGDKDGEPGEHVYKAACTAAKCGWEKIEIGVRPFLIFPQSK
jgi:hypothetical protein